MPIHHPLAFAGGQGSDAITNALGVVAVVAFAGTVMYIVVVHLRESARRAAAARLRREMSGGESQQPKTLLDFDDNYGAEMKRLKDSLEEFYRTTLDAAGRKLEDLWRYADVSYHKISESYGAHSFGAEGETRKNRIAKFESLCERQFGYFRDDMSFIEYNEVNDKLRPILEAARILDAHVTRRADEQSEVTVEMMRSQEIVSIARAVIKDRASALQSEAFDALGSFCEYYDRSVKEWINDRVFRVVGKMRERGEKGLTIGDTDYTDRFNNLKGRLEMVARLSERISQNTQKASDDSVAICQVIHVATLLRTLAEMPMWFPDALAPKAEGAVGAGAVAAAGR